MNSFKSRSDHDLYRKLKWLTFFRGLFAAVLFGSVMLVLLKSPTDLLLIAEPLLWLCIVSLIMIFLSMGYGIILSHVKRLTLFAYIQIGIDTLFISLLVFFTGCFSSVFPFLYLVVIVYSCMILYQRGGMIMSTLCSIEYGLMIDFEYYGLIRPPGFDPNFLTINYDWHYVVYRLIITIAACYLVAFLSGFLSGQERRAKLELWGMEEQVKRVEKLASIGEVAAGMAHEIKNPLASLTGSIQMLTKSIPYDPVHDKLMKIILREADRLTSLVSEFLMFARPVAVNPLPVTLDTSISEILDLFASDPKCRGGIKIIRKFHPGISIMIDQEHLRQVAWNLLNNASQAVDKDGTITISIYPLKKSHACITVSDNGCGIEKEKLNTIFDPFFSTKQEGTGLGLSIVQQIVSSYNGFIDVESEPEKGTRVTVRFPRVSPRTH
ncbi:MAG: GHKL domain-containing protein [Deltaproteobacteria bacterium]|nr:GHKL domain-containing protein [Deltaproteobacteria bacterium]